MPLVDRVAQPFFISSPSTAQHWRDARHAALHACLCLRVVCLVREALASAHAEQNAYHRGAARAIRDVSGLICIPQAAVICHRQ